MGLLFKWYVFQQVKRWCNAIFVIAVCFLLHRISDGAQAVVLRFNGTTTLFMSQPLLLPTRFPRLVQDPQNLPFGKSRFFSFGSQGTIAVDLTVRIIDASKAQDQFTFWYSTDSPHGKADNVQQNHPISLQWPSNDVRVGSENDAVSALRATAYLERAVNFCVAALRGLGGGLAHVVPLHYKTTITRPGTWAPFGSDFDTTQCSNREARKSLNLTTQQHAQESLSRKETEESLRRVRGSMVPLSLARRLLSSELTRQRSSDISANNSVFLPFFSLGEDASTQGWDTLRYSKNSLVKTTTDPQQYLMLFSETQWRNINLTFTHTDAWDISGDFIATANDHSMFSPFALTSYLKSDLRVPIEGSGVTRVNFHHRVAKAGNYIFLLLNPLCVPFTIDGTISMFSDGANHLPQDSILLQPILFICFLLNSLTTLVILVMLLTVWRNSRTELHSLMTVNFFFKSVYLIMDWVNISLFSQRGELDVLHWVLPQLVAKVKDITSLMLLLLLALGWKVYRRNLSLIEARFCAGFCIMSFYFGIFEASVGGFQASREVLHSLSYLVVIVAIKFNITLLEVSVGDVSSAVYAAVQSYLHDMDLGATTAKTYHKCIGYRRFRTFFFVFILKPSILLFYKVTWVEVSFLPPNGDQDWILVILDNFIDWLLFSILLYIFRPFKNFRLFEHLQVHSLSLDSEQQGSGSVDLRTRQRNREENETDDEYPSIDPTTLLQIVPEVAS